MKLSAPSVGMLCAWLWVLMLNPLPLASQEYQREVDRLAEEVSEIVSRAALRNVAVVDFTDLQGNVQELGRFMAEELTTSLVLKERQFRTIDRANLRSILLEAKLSTTGIVSPENAKKLKISGVDGLIRGSLTPFGDSIRLTIQVIAVDSAQIVGAARGLVPKTAAMETLGDDIDSSISQPSSNGSSASSAPAKRKLTFQDGTLRITLKYFRKDSGNSIKAIFQIENLTKEVLYVSWYSPQLVDDLGEQWRLTERSGIEQYQNQPGNVVAQGTFLTALLVFKQDRASAGSRAAKFNVVGPITVRDENSRERPFFPNLQDIGLGV